MSHRKLRLATLRIGRLALVVLLCFPLAMPAAATAREEGQGWVYCEARVAFTLSFGCNPDGPSASAILVGTGGPVSTARITVEWDAVSVESESLELHYTAAAAMRRVEGYAVGRSPLSMEVPPDVAGWVRFHVGATAPSLPDSVRIVQDQPYTWTWETS